MEREVSHWRVALAVIITEAVMIGLAYGWVAIYSTFLQPGHDFATYQQYARRASPLVSLAVGPLVFAALGFIFTARRPGVGERELRWTVGIYLALDVVVVLLLADDLAYNVLLWVPNAVTKVLAGWAGIRLAHRAR